MIDKKHCIGCEDNFYNENNPYGIKECWSLKDAKLIMRKPVGINERPPWTRKSEKLPSFYSQKGTVFVEPSCNSLKSIPNYNLSLIHI